MTDTPSYQTPIPWNTHRIGKICLWHSGPVFQLNAVKTKSLVEIGLCQTCQHVKIIENANQNRFYLCLLSKSDADFQMYPHLPVLICPGYHPQNQTSSRKGRPS